MHISAKWNDCAILIAELEMPWLKVETVCLHIPLRGRPCVPGPAVEKAPRPPYNSRSVRSPYSSRNEPRSKILKKPLTICDQKQLTLRDVWMTFPGNVFPGKWLSGKRLSGKRFFRETTFRESDFPGNVFPGNVFFRETTFRESDFPKNVSPGNVFSGKHLSGKVTFRETTVNPWEIWYHDLQSTSSIKINVWCPLIWLYFWRSQNYKALNNITLWSALLHRATIN